MVANAAQAPKKNSTDPGERIPVLTKRKARNLYLFEDASAQRIAAECGLTLFAAQKLPSREGWTKERRQRMANLVAKQDARMNRIDDEIIDAIASQSEELALSAIGEARKEVSGGGEFAARNFQSWSAGVKNFASIAKMLRDPVNQPGGEGTSVLNLYLIRAGDVVSEAKPVVDVSAKPVQ